MRRILCGGFFIIALSSVAAPAALPAKIDFNRDIRPILSDTCYACHGPDAKKLKAGLRLDLPEMAVKPAKSGKRAIVPKQPAASELVARITAKNPDDVMPPADSNKKLTPQQVALLTRWIEQGAEFRAHWAYDRPQSVTAPKVERAGFVRNDVDRFILAKLEEKKLAPAAEADRVTLIRRLSFDLTGLPPSWAEVQTFVNDKAPDAYERLVDRLLASPHYGERMAASWLDMVRYADTKGYHSDNHQSAPLYRDYVINAFNQNLPYDQFTRDQLAGDLLPNPTRWQLIASGYNRMNMCTEEGGAQAKEYLAKYMSDRVRNTSTVWMASTLGCAECHDHKYDPFGTKDFYSFGAFFADLKETAVGKQEFTAVPADEDKARVAALDAEIAALKVKLAQTDLSAAQAVWEKQTLAQALTNAPQTDATWIASKPAKADATGGVKLQPQDDASVLAAGANPAKSDYTLTLGTDLEQITALRLETLKHPSLAANGLSRANGNFVLTGLEVRVTGKDGTLQPVKFTKALASFSQTGHPVDSLIAGGGVGWAVDGHVNPKEQRAMFVFDKPIAGGPGTTIQVVLRHQSPYPQHQIGRFRLALTRAPQPGLGADGGLPAEILAALKIAPAQRTPAQQKTVGDHYRAGAPELDGQRKAIVAKEKVRDDASKVTATSLVSMTVAPRPIRILPRGNWLDESGLIVEPAVPVSLKLQAIEGRRATRLDLAQWIVAPENPLTARVMVNRLWRQMFGEGLVATLDDFGAQGTPPTHPELLDWLANEFVRSGWNVKSLLRVMALSGAYRQSSVATPAVVIVDPYNQWLARQGRWRLEAEMVRDNALLVSGLLVRTIGGESVKPYQPAGYWAYLNFPTREWQADKGDGLYRRGLYTYWCRTFPHPSLIAFDAPSREECTVKRVKSTTPQQALVLLNDPAYVEAARVLAERVLREGGADAKARLAYAWQEVLHRAPKPQEAELLAALVARHHEQYKADAAAAGALLQTGDRAVDAKLDKAELAAWTSVARVLLNLHETITRN